MMACFRANWEEFYGEVLLLDDRRITLTAERGIKKSSKAAAILHLVFSHLNLIEVEFFGLRFCDKKQQTLWLDPSKTLSQHRELIGPPYIFYFGVKFYVEDPSKLTEETTRYQFYLQLRQDVRRGRLPCPAHLRARLFALMLQGVDTTVQTFTQYYHHIHEFSGTFFSPSFVFLFSPAERDEQGEVDQLDCDENQDVQNILQTLSGVSPPQAQRLLLSLCSSLQMFGVSLFAAYGENQTEYFLGPTPVGVVIYKSKVLVGKYFWQRITKLHFKDETFQLRVVGKNGSETSFFFQTSGRSVCKRLWRCCVEHHVFFRMTNSSIQKLRHNSVSGLPTLTLPNNNKIREMRRDGGDDEVNNDANQTMSLTSEPMRMQMAPPAVQRQVMAEQERGMPCAPWASGAPVSGLFNPKFPPNAKEKQDGGKRRTRSLDGDRPIRQQRTRSHCHGNISSGSESERTTSNTERRAKNRVGRQGNRRPSAASRYRARSCSPHALTWKHIQKQLVEPDGLIDRLTEEIPYQEIRVSGEPMRNYRSARRRRHHKWALTSDLRSKSEMVAPLPVTVATSLPVDNSSP